MRNTGASATLAQPEGPAPPFRGRVVTRLVTYATSDSALADLALEE